MQMKWHKLITCMCECLPAFSYSATFFEREKKVPKAIKMHLTRAAKADIVFLRFFKAGWKKTPTTSSPGIKQASASVSVALISAKKAAVGRPSAVLKFL